MDPNIQAAKLSCILYASEPNSIKGSGPSCSDMKESKRKFSFLSLCIFKQEQPAIKLFDIRKRETSLAVLLKKLHNPVWKFETLDMAMCQCKPDISDNFISKQNNTEYI